MPILTSGGMLRSGLIKAPPGMLTPNGLINAGVAVDPALEGLISNGMYPTFFADFSNDVFVVSGARKTFTEIFTATRASIAYYFGSNGLLTQAAINEVRFTYNPVTLTRIGLLAETTATNSLLYSNTFTNAAWVKTNMTVVADAVGIDGVTNSATTLTATAASASVLQSLTTGMQRSFSLYMKRKTGTGTVLLTRDGGTTTTDVTGQINSSTFTLVQVADSNVTTATSGVILSTSGDEVIVFAAQDENNRAASSRVFTTAAAVTRAQDFITNSSANTVPFASWFADNNDTLLWHAATPAANGVVGDYMGIEPTFPDYLSFGVNNNNFQFYGNMGSRNNTTKAAFSTLAKNLTTAAKDNVSYTRTNTRSTARTLLNLNSWRATHVRLVYWPQNVSAVECQRITTL